MLWLFCLFMFLCLGVYAAQAVEDRHRKRKHSGPADRSKYKFDEAEVARGYLVAPPPIDVTNLPPVNIAAQAGMQTITAAGLEKLLKELSGEVQITVSGKAHTMYTRSTYHKDLEQALQYLEEQYRSLGISTSRHAYKVRGRTLYNLVAELPGTVKPEQVLIIGSHVDSTAGRQWQAEPVAPGADDDGSGTVALLELARCLAPMQRDHTIRFVHFTGEEQGLWGSYAYSDKVNKDKTSVIAMLQIDMIGYCGKPGNRVDIHDEADRHGSHDLTVSLVRNIHRYGLQLNAVDTHNYAVKDRSDHAGFLDHGYKAVLISEEFTPSGFNPHYHSTKDRVAAMNLPYMVEVVKMVLATAVDLSNSR